MSKRDLRKGLLEPEAPESQISIMAEKAWQQEQEAERANPEVKQSCNLRALLPR